MAFKIVIKEGGSARRDYCWPSGVVRTFQTEESARRHLPSDFRVFCGRAPGEGELDSMYDIVELDPL